MPAKKIQDNFKRIYQPRKNMLLNNFLGGIAWSVGTLIGATIIVGIIGLVISKINLVPVIGSWIVQMIEAGKQYSVK